jgi:hypothetical protein
MKKLLLAITLLAPAILFAQSPFDGTWKTDMDKAKFSPKPIIFSTSNGMYDCSSCAPQINVKADGTDQPVTGQAYDTIAVKEVDAHSIQVMTKKNGKTTLEQNRTASDDGKTLHVKSTSYPPDSDKPVMSEAELERMGAKPAAGANATSGSWKIKKVKEEENGLLDTYKGSGNELTWSNPTGGTWTAKMDGQDYPAKGVNGYDMVSLKQAGNNGIEVSFKRGGQLIEVDKMTLSPDGKTMTTVAESKLTGRVSTFVAHKQ